MATNAEVIRFFTDKDAHYKFSDDFVKKYQQKNGGYICLACASEEIKLDKNKAEPNQKWHLLISYYCEKIKKEKEYKEKKANLWRYLRCPELMLWMAEAAGIDIKEAKKEAESSCEEGNRIAACVKIRKLIPWKEIESKILASKSTC